MAADGGAPDAAAAKRVAISGDGRYVAFESSATNLVASPAPLSSPNPNIYVRDLCIGISAPSTCVSHTDLVSVDASGNFGAGASNSPSISSDGRFIAFASAAADLVAGGANVSGSGVYVRDTCAGSSPLPTCEPRTFFVGFGGSDGVLVQNSSDVMISGDGHYVVFTASSVSSLGSPDQAG